MNDTIHEQALLYAARGWPVHPLSGKKPILTGWPSLATTDPNIIHSWWIRYPRANVGIATGRRANLMVLDVDPRHGGDESLQDLEWKYGLLPKTVEVKTGSGGRHLYFQYPGTDILNSEGVLALGLDIKTEGGQVVAPPSVHPDTKQAYSWEVSHHPDDVPVATAPPWLLDQIRKAQNKKPDVEQEDGETIPDGQRNTRLTSLGGSMRRKGATEAEIYAALTAFNASRCLPPLPDDEVRRIAQSLGRYPTADDGWVKEMADAIQGDTHFAKDSGGMLYAFENGVYRPTGETVVGRRVKEIAIATKTTKQWSTRRASEVAAWIAVDAPTLWERPPITILNVRNGLLDLATGKLNPHNPLHLSPIQLPMNYDPDAKCPRWDAFLKEVFPEDCSDLAYEIVGASMAADASIQQAILLVGEGANGKSAFLSALIAFLGAVHVANISLQQLERDKFATARLVGKLANVCADLPSADLMGTSVFKAVTGGDPISAERKFKTAFEFRPFCRLIFSANHYPQSRDSSAAFFRRWIVIPFGRTFAPNERRSRKELDTELADPCELSGVLNRAVVALRNVQARGGFTQSASMKTAAAEFVELTDPISAWLDRSTQADPDGAVSKKDLAIAYNAAAHEEGRPPISAKTFYAGVRRLRPTLTETKRDGEPVFNGLRLQPEVF